MTAGTQYRFGVSARDAAWRGCSPTASRSSISGKPTEFRRYDEIVAVSGAGGPTVAQAYIARGWDECRDSMEQLISALSTPDDGGDVCAATGEGWVAEEALATALHAAVRHVDDSVAALGRAAATNGDSDSIACLTGALHGAAYGIGTWPGGWARRIEYGDQLAELAASWD